MQTHYVRRGSGIYRPPGRLPFTGAVDPDQAAGEPTATEAALRTSEEHLRLIFDAAPIGMALVAVDGRFLQVNPALCAIVGYDAAELMDTTFQAITHPDDLEADLDHLEDCLAGTIDGYGMTKRYVHHDGHAVWVELKVVVVRDADGVAGPLRLADPRHQRAPGRRSLAGRVRGSLRRHGRARQRPHLHQRS